MAERTRIVVPISHALSCFTGTVVKISVGEDTTADPQTFFVHAELLKLRSTFFVKALKNYAQAGQGLDEVATPTLDGRGVAWREGQEGIIRLPIDDPDVFANYVHLIYTGIMPTFHEPEKPKAAPNDTPDEAKKRNEEWQEACLKALGKLYRTLTKLYVFCDKVQNATAKRMLLASFVEASNMFRTDGARFYPQFPIINDIYTNTLPSDPLREYLVDIFVQHGISDWLSKGFDYYPLEFCFSVLRSMMREREGSLDYSEIRDAKYYQDKVDELEMGHVFNPRYMP